MKINLEVSTIVKEVALPNSGIASSGWDAYRGNHACPKGWRNTGIGRIDQQ